MSTHADRTRIHYDENTKRFMRLGHSFEGTIHRAVWGPGVKTRREALLYVEDLIAARVAGASAPGAAPREIHIVDLGCGVCASLGRIAERTQASGTGVTISRMQVNLAQERIRAAGMDQRVRCVEADFCELPESVAPADVVYAVEAFVHASNPGRFFAACARLVRPGGLLIVCDDIVSDAGLFADPRAARWLKRFRDGWLAASLVDSRKFAALAHESGFAHVEDLDLTGYLELGRPRDLAIAALMRGIGWLPVRASYWAMLRGGHALQVALQRGYIRYLFSVWRRSA